jgi:hypothetical protein
VRRRGRAAAVVALAALLAGCGDAAPGTAAGTASPAATAPEPVRTAPATADSRPCPPGGVLVTTGPVDGALGLRAVTLRLTNCGRDAYQVTGYPDVGVLDDDGRPVPVAVTQGTRPGDPVVDPGPRTTVLRRGESAEAALLWRQLVEVRDAENVTGPLTVDLGGGQERQTLPLSVDLGTTRLVTVTAWSAPRGR